MRSVNLAVGMIVVVALCAPAAAFDFNVSAGLDFNGDFDGYESGTETGYSLGLEACFDIPVVEVGVGMEYGFPRNSDTDSFDLDYTFLYAVGRVGMIGPLYLTARVGYADVSANDLTSGDLDGGETWSAGVGAEFLDRIKVEALLNNFSAEFSGVNSDFDYQTYSLRVIYTFGK